MLATPALPECAGNTAVCVVNAAKTWKSETSMTYMESMLGDGMEIMAMVIKYMSQILSTNLVTIWKATWTMRDSNSQYSSI